MWNSYYDNKVLMENENDNRRIHIGHQLKYWLKYKSKPSQYHTKSYITYQILVEIQVQTQAISYDSPRGGVSQITEKGETTASFLLIQVAFL